MSRRLEHLPLGNTDGKYLRRMLAALNPPEPVRLTMAGSLGLGDIAHRSATSAAVGSYVAVASAAQHPLTGIVVGHEPGRLVVRLDDPSERFTVRIRPGNA